MVGSLDAENLEFFILGDLNVNLDQSIESSNKNTLNELFDIYGLDQLIQEATRVTESFSSLNDLCLTNSLTTVVDSGVTHLSISDHSLIYVVRKAHYVQTDAKIIEARTSGGARGGGKRGQMPPQNYFLPPPPVLDNFCRNH